MAVSVTTADEETALAARVTQNETDIAALTKRIVALETTPAPVPTPVPTPTPTPTPTPAPVATVIGLGGAVTMTNGQVLRLTTAGVITVDNVALAGGDGSGQASYDPAANKIHGQDASSGTWWDWVPATSSWSETGWTPAAPTPVPTPNPAPSPIVTAGHFGVTVKGFTDPAGKAWSMRGLNAGVQDALQGFANVFKPYPGLNTIRLNCNSGGDLVTDIDKVVKLFTAKGVVVIIEDHGGNTRNVAWYTQMATAYRGNPYVMLETLNEPNGSVASDQIAVINAIHATGFANPIGIQPIGGYDQSNVPTVAKQFGAAQMFVTPHIYYGGSDPGGAAQYVANEIASAAQNGMFASIDEFGDAMDGWNRDPQGMTVITAVLASNVAGKCGAVFWAMDNGNHPNGADSAFLVPDGSQLTPVGTQLKPWLA